ncbi:MAG: isoprenylcysteine carboxylmethyltransferase family protein [Ardenticatenaceae bacterium]|nr:isoprenylcysteine carboxylmethyltransferase family protein [Ardenticatenaceae bacterium]MCB9445481.1 isoprenylcysteine carboxylmethyltransferase family protein [Ardenticatenaceae bacterium]
MTSEIRRAINKWVFQAALGVIGYGTIIFLAAGTTRWVWGWMLLIVVTAVMAAHPLLLIPINPELLAEREKGVLDEGVKRWDKWINMGAGTMMMVTWVVAGLDVRLGWTANWPLAAHLAGLLFNILGYALFMWSMTANAFFAEGVRIQTERGHTVATDGPYRFVRHPGYVGAITANLATPVLLGSWWAFLPAVVLAVLYILRTALEDRTLQAELPGYVEFTRQTRFRLLPGVW